MKCPELKNRLSQYIDRQLPEAEARELETHLDGCASCRKLLDETRAALAFAKKAGLRPLPPDFMARLNDRLDRETAPRAVRRPAFSFGFAMRTAAGVATLFLCVVIARNAWQDRAAMKAVTGSISNEVAYHMADENLREAEPEALLSSPARSAEAIREKKEPPPAQRAETAHRPLPQAEVLKKQAWAAPSVEQSPGHGQEDAVVAELPAQSLSAQSMNSPAPAPAAPAPAGEQREVSGDHVASGATMFESRESGIAGFVGDLKAGVQPFGGRQSGRRSLEPAADKADAGGALPLRRGWSGSYSGVTEPVRTVIRDRAAWQELWSRHDSSGMPAPAVDFTRFMVAAVFTGERPSGGYTATIERVVVESGRTAVYYSEGTPAPDAAAIAVLTQPFHIAVTDRSDLPVEFIKTSR